MCRRRQCLRSCPHGRIFRSRKTSEYCNYHFCGVRRNSSHICGTEPRSRKNGPCKSRCKKYAAYDSRMECNLHDTCIFSLENTLPAFLWIRQRQRCWKYRLHISELYSGHIRSSEVFSFTEMPCRVWDTGLFQCLEVYLSLWQEQELYFSLQGKQVLQGCVLQTRRHGSRRWFR